MNFKIYPFEHAQTISILCKGWINPIGKVDNSRMIEMVVVYLKN